MQCNYVVWNPIILTIILKYMYNIKNCITVSSCVAVWDFLLAIMEIKI